MSLLKELEYYCKKEKPTGAIMLDGEWGTGKTYFIEEVFRKKYEDDFVLVRLSLFGVDSIESIHKRIKQAWIEKFTEEIGVKKACDMWGKGEKIIKKLKLPEGIDQLLNIELADILFMKTHINDKSVVLVFDDLERSKLDVVDVLGCINGYCENQGFHTIILADENKIKQSRSKDCKLTYSDVKEKIVYKTIKYSANYKKVISTIIQEMQFEEEYRSLLLNNSQNLANIFEVNGNIRSMKCALQDFERIYIYLKKESINNINKYLFSFISLILYSKETKIVEKTLVSELETRYRNWFDPKYLLEAERDWIISGKWNEEQFSREIELWVKRIDSNDKHLLSTKYLLDIDDECIERDFEATLNDAYIGKLLLQEYLLFIVNISKLREYEYYSLVSVDWERLMNGIKLKERSLLTNPFQQVIIREEYEISNFSEEEKRAYSQIMYFWKHEIRSLQEKEIYLNCIAENSYVSWRKCKDKKCTLFDEEMASKTATYFEKLSNEERNFFVVEFIEFLEICLQEKEFEKEESTKNIQILVTLLNKGMGESDNEKTKIKSAIYRNFIRDIQKYLERVKKKAL